MEEGRSAFKILTGTPAGKNPLGKPRHRWEANIRMDLKKIVVNMRNSVNSAQDRDYWSPPYECGIEPPGIYRIGFSMLQYQSIALRHLDRK